MRAEDFAWRLGLREGTTAGCGFSCRGKLSSSSIPGELVAWALVPPSTGARERAEARRLNGGLPKDGLDPSGPLLPPAKLPGVPKLPSDHRLLPPIGGERLFGGGERLSLFWDVLIWLGCAGKLVRRPGLVLAATKLSSTGTRLLLKGCGGVLTATAFTLPFL
mmetsp:Transcript_2923/g.5043  ORF Transcript_2923/g.5043 Transcript_2923/m.5043 type:complete len:163 (+) Transcript_2923:181-669(+)